MTRKDWGQAKELIKILEEAEQVLLNALHRVTKIFELNSIEIRIEIFQNLSIRSIILRMIKFALRSFGHAATEKVSNRIDTSDAVSCRYWRAVS